MTAPAGSAALPAPPSAPSVSAASAAIGRMLQRVGQRQRICSDWGRRGVARTVTVSSPPDTMAVRLPAPRRQRQPRMVGGNVARLAFEVGAETDHFVPTVTCDLDRGI